MNKNIIILLILFANNICDAQIWLSHNDYEQSTPLHNAMENDVDIIEADIHLYNGKIVVCHDQDDASNAENLERLYLQPMKNYGAQTLDGKILMLDVKEYSDELLDSLLSIIHRNESLFTQIDVLLTGEYSRSHVSALDINNKLLLDGRQRHIGSTKKSLPIPIISMKINNLTRWKGQRRITKSEATKIKSHVDNIQSTGRKVRFWNVKDHPQNWNILKVLGVDIIGTDDLEMMKKYKGDKL